MLVPIRPSPIMPSSMRCYESHKSRGARSSETSDVGQFDEGLVVWRSRLRQMLIDVRTLPDYSS